MDISNIVYEKREINVDGQLFIRTEERGDPSPRWLRVGGIFEFSVSEAEVLVLEAEFQKQKELDQTVQFNCPCKSGKTITITRIN